MSSFFPNTFIDYKRDLSKLYTHTTGSIYLGSVVDIHTYDYKVPGNNTLRWNLFSGYPQYYRAY